MQTTLSEPGTATGKYGRLKNFINGGFAAVTPGRSLPVISPLDGSLLAEMPCSSAADLDAAVAAAQAAFPAWSRTPIKERVQVFFRYKYLLEKNLEELAALVSEENGKTRSEAVAEIEKCIELTEFATSLPQLVAGEVLEVSKGVECRTERTAIGVVASIVPFNFPAMVPNWTIPNALALGNCMIIKPSEKVPLSVGRIALLLHEAGLPDGVFNIVNGDSQTVQAICDHPGIEAISFVGSTKVAKLVYQRATHQLKRCLALGGAKNHLLVLPDAQPEMTAQNVAAYERLRWSTLYGRLCNGGCRECGRHHRKDLCRGPPHRSRPKPWRRHRPGRQGQDRKLYYRGRTAGRDDPGRRPGI
jgi:malonate-semialdehyde dehydrogenase (acetylating)/methylmalonate-semialdehyde dehydrogenase